MKYYYEKPAEWIGAGEVYICDHPLYNQCTLFRKDDLGLAVIQERYNQTTKDRRWSTVDPWLAGDIYLNEGFGEYFRLHAGKCNENRLYPTVSIRKIMWALRMKPLRKEIWEEPFS